MRLTAPPPAQGGGFGGTGLKDFYVSAFSFLHSTICQIGYRGLQLDITRVKSISSFGKLLERD